MEKRLIFEIVLTVWVIWISWKIENLLKFRHQSFQYLQRQENVNIRLMRSLTKPQADIYNDCIKCDHCGRPVPKEVTPDDSGTLYCIYCNEAVKVK